MQINLAEKVLQRIFPFLEWWPEVNKGTLKADLVAGLTGAVIVLPQGVAFATIAGLPPIYGLYTAMITPIVAALFGSSRHLVSGPTTAISLVVFAALTQLGAEPGTDDFIAKALTITLLAGIFQFLLGVGRMGTLINFVSHVVVVGFTAGAALLIMQSQLKHLLDLPVAGGSTFVKTLKTLALNIHHTNFFALGVGLFTLLLAIFSKKYLPKIPNLMVALVGGSLLAWGLAQVFGSEQVALKMVGEVKGRLPRPSLPDLGFDSLTQLAQSAFAIALLGLIEAVAIARSIAVKSQQQIDGNQEFIGQGLSNIVGSFFSCYAGSGSFTRSGINYEAGARTPLAAVFAALMLVVIVLLVAPLIAYLPIAAMAGVIMMVGYNLIDFKFARTVMRSSRRQSMVMLITFVATLVADLEMSVIIGVMFSLIFYLQKASTPNVAVMAPDPDDANRRFTYLLRKQLPECPQMKTLRLDGSIFFGSVNHISSEIRELVDEASPDVHSLLIVAQGINFIDVAGSEWLLHEAKRWEQKGGGLYFTGLKLNAQETLIRGGFRAEIGEEHFFVSKEEALRVLVPMMLDDVCANCRFRIFNECAGKPNLNQAAIPENAGAI
ncbi:MAG: SulP family inorganic anion transporter [Saprospiraceae bacterium]|nr:SulP family inorganic anion transporter [Saprospiraceae bacterium]